jgi:lysyl-tRNA synthetase, class II
MTLIVASLISFGQLGGFLHSVPSTSGVLGTVVWVSDRQSVSDRLSPMRSRVPALVAWVLRVVAVLSLTALLHRSGRANVGRLQDAALSGVALTVAIMLSALALVLARALTRRKRRAWRFALLLAGLSSALYLHRHTWMVGLLNVAVLVLLLWTRGEFRAQSEPNSRWLALSPC